MHLYTIGHSTHSIQNVVDILRSNEITSVCDVRSVPYSKHTPQFDRESLKRSIVGAGLHYVYLGNQLGGRSKNPRHYAEGQVQYDRLASSSAFRQGLDRLDKEMAQNIVVLMCTEKDPLNCHRAILITRQLRTSMVEILHIMFDGTTETNEKFENRLRLAWKLPVHDIFGDDESLISHAYELQGRKIAYSAASGIISEEGSDL